MAYWIDNNEACVGQQKPFYCDSAADVASLPTSSAEGTPQADTVAHHKVAPGSSAYIIAEGKLYILDSNDNWVEQ